MCNNNSEILRGIMKEFLNTNEWRNIRLPGGIDFCIIAEDTVQMKLKDNAVCANMQSDAAAFEGWALVIKRWTKFKKVIICWDKPNEINDGHYQRFLFRLTCFIEDFKSWFSIDDSCKDLLNASKIKPGKIILVNMPLCERRNESSSNAESILETRFVNGNLKKCLMDITNADFLDKQLPVGVFENEIKDKTRIFTGRKSAIDIWGFTKSNEDITKLKELLVFELKAENNTKIGIITELYFYVCVLQKLQKGIFKYKDSSHEKLEKKKVNAYFLCRILHPLIDKKILDLLNEVNPNEVKYRYININKDDKLTLVFD
ncbi:MAG TPA: hypothetical protein VFW07_01260 [Parafilimonas sp.]|nr:hypothetical protein [Parafilimonas sp.]